MAEKKLTRKEKQAASQQQKPQGTPRKRQQGAGALERSLGLLLAAVAFVIYFNTLGHGYTHDDFSVIKENSVVTQGAKAIPEILKTTYRYGYLGMNDGTYRPLSLVLFAIEWSIAPDSPAFGHFMNVALYALTAFLLFMLLARLMRNYNIVIPFIAALLFVVHPLHTEVVASIKSHDELLCFLFSLLTIWFTFDHLENKKTSKLVIAAVCFFLALLSKETAITMMAVIPLTIFFFSKTETAKNLKTTAVFLVPAVIFLLIRAKVIGSNEADHAIAMADNVIAGAPDGGTRLGTAFYVMAQYIKLLVFPYPMVSDYSLNLIPLVKFTNILSIAGLLFHVGIAVYAFRQLKKKDLIAYGILFYLITIALFSNVLILIGATMAERFLYFPSLGFTLAVAVLLGKLTKTENGWQDYGNISNFFKRNTVVLGIAGAAALCYSFMTISRNPDWKDNYALYSKDAVTGKESYRMHYYLGRHIIKEVAPAEPDSVKRRQLFEQGIAELDEAIRIYPSYSDAHSQKGVGYTRIDRLDKAIESYEAGIKLNPNDAIALNNLATVFFAQRKIGDAIEAFKKVTRLNPRYADAYVNLGSCYGTVGDFKSAIDAFQKALAIEPVNTKALMYLSQTYGNMGDKTNADLYYNKAVQIDPSLKK